MSSKAGFSDTTLDLGSDRRRSGRTLRVRPARIWLPMLSTLAIAAAGLAPSHARVALAARLEPPPVEAGQAALSCVDVNRDGACSPVEVTSSADELFGGIRRQLDAAAEELGSEDELARAGKEMDEARVLLDLSAEELAGGDPCAASRSFAGGAEALRAARATLGKVVQARQGALRGTASERSDDVSEGDEAAAWLGLRAGLFARHIDEVLGAQEVVDGVCRSVKGKLRARGRVVETDDDARIVRLDSGALLAIARAQSARGVSVGRRIDARGVAFTDGSGVAVDIKARARADKPPKFDERCLALRVAPVQPFPPQFSTAPTLHFPQAYEVGGALALEDGMRLGAQAVNGCPTATPDGRAILYSMRIVVEQDGVAETIAYDLEDGEAPVRLPKRLSRAKAGSYPPLAVVTATVSRTSCRVLPGPLYSCPVPTPISVETHYVQVLPRGFYASVKYDETTFGVAENGVSGDFEPASVSEISALFSVEDTQAELEAQGYRAWAGGSSFPQVMPVVGSQPFAVFAEDFSAPTGVIDGLLAAESRFWATGQSTRSALRWAHVRGTRNGRTFWYSARLPRLARDRIALCPEEPAFLMPQGPERIDDDPLTPANWPPSSGPFQVIAAENSFYEMPLPAGFHHPWDVKGNIDDPSATRRHGESQAYAVDFVAPMNTSLMAARGGVVVEIEERDRFRLSDPARPAFWPLMGNYIYIRHDDGTYAVYYHLVENGALVTAGQRVVRGQLIGLIGETGRASGPHVHFGVARRKTSNPVDPDAVRVRYRMGVQERGEFPPAEVTLESCYIPRSVHMLLSSHG